MQNSISDLIKGYVAGLTSRVLSPYFARITQGGGIYEVPQCVESALNSQNVLNNASFILIPSGYKGGTLYSELPINGNGDLTWVRGSDAFRTNASGLIQRVPWNLLQQSETFDTGSWTKVNVTVTANTTTAPNGTLTADKVIATNTASTTRAIYQSFTPSSAQRFNFSVYAKASEYSRLALQDITNGRFGASFDLSAQTTASLGGAGFVSSSITNVGNGWFLCSVVWDSVASSLTALTTIGYPSGASLNAAGISYAGDGTSGIFIWGAQLVEGTTAQTYLPTTDRLNFPRLSYMYGSCPSALVEPQRTNSLRNSTMVGASTSPSTLPTNWTSFTTHGLTVAIAGVGTENGVNYIDISYTGTATTSDAVRIGFEQSLQISASNGQSWSLSTYAKIISQSAPPSSYDLRMTERALVGGGVVTLGTQSITPTSTLTRFTYTRTLSGGSTVGYVAPEFSVPVINGTSYNFTIRIAQPQMELGAYATTPIPTTTASATRIADSFSRNNIYTNGLISASGGTWFVELRNNVAYVGDAGGDAIILGDSSSTLGNNFRLYNPPSSSRLQILKTISNAITTLYTTTTATTKIAIKWNGSTADVFVNGTKQVSATAFTATALEFFYVNNVAVPRFIQTMALFSTPLSDTDCTTLTT